MAFVYFHRWSSVLFLFVMFKSSYFLIRIPPMELLSLISACPNVPINPRIVSRPVIGATAPSRLRVELFNSYHLDFCITFLLFLIKMPASLSVNTQISETGTSLISILSDIISFVNTNFGQTFISMVIS